MKVEVFNNTIRILLTEGMIIFDIPQSFATLITDLLFFSPSRELQEEKLVNRRG